MFKAWILAIAFGVSQLGSTAVVFSVGAELIKHQRVQDLMLVFSCTALAAPIAHLWGGLIVDALSGAKRVFITGATVACVSQLTLAALIGHYGATLWLLVPFLMVTKFSASLASSSSQRLIRGMFTSQELHRVTATVSLVKTIGMVAAPLVATFLALYGTLSWALSFDALTFLLALLLVAGLREKQLVPPPKLSMFTRICEGVTFCRNTVGLRTVLVVDCIACGLWSVSFNVGLQAVTLSASDGGQKAWGFVVSASVVGILVGGLIARQFQLQRPLTGAMVASSGTALPIASVLLPWGTTTAVVLTFIGYCGIGAAAAWSSYGLQKLVPSQLLGRVFALSIATQLAAPPLVGLVSRTCRLDFQHILVPSIFALGLLVAHAVGIRAALQVDSEATQEKAPNVAC